MQVFLHIWLKTSFFLALFPNLTYSIYACRSKKELLHLREAIFTLIQFKLTRVELIVFTLLLDKVFVVASFDDFALFKHHDCVGIADG